MESTPLAFLIVSGLASTVSVVHLWGWRAGSILRKAFWTVLVWTPLLGPLFYLTMYRIPKEKDELHKGMGAETHSAG